MRAGQYSRATSRVTTTGEIAKLPLKFAGGVNPILLSEVATVGIGANFRTGASTDNAEEALVGAELEKRFWLTGVLDGKAAQALAIAQAEERDNSPMMIAPNIAVYTR